MKKQLFLIFFLILCLLLASCSYAKASSPAETTAPVTESAVTGPSAPELKEGFFLPVSGLEKGTAGSSLKEANGAMKVLSFAENKLITSISSSGDSEQSHDTVDQDALQSALLDAWNSLSAEEQAPFSENYPFPRCPVSLRMQVFCLKCRRLWRIPMFLPRGNSSPIRGQTLKQIE